MIDISYKKPEKLTKKDASVYLDLLDYHTSGLSLNRTEHIKVLNAISYLRTYIDEFKGDA